MTLIHAQKQRLQQVGCCLLLLLLFFAPGTASATGKNHFLWSITGTQNTVYLLGSLHMMKRDAYPLSAPIMEAYKKSGKLIFETNVRELGSFEYQAKLMVRGMLPRGTTLQEQIAADLHEKLRQYLEKNQMDIRHFARLKPWMCALTLTMMEFNKRGMHSDYGLESYFLLKGSQDAKIIDGLVGVDEHIDVLASFDCPEQELFLAQTLKELNMVGAMTEQMQDAWLSGNTEALANLMQESYKEAPEVYDQILTVRNKKWLPRIEHYLTEKYNVMVIVGSGHLVGADSVVELLRAKGYTVTQH